MTFTDDSKLEDVSKVCCRLINMHILLECLKQLLYASHNVLEMSESGYNLLQCLRSYLILDTYLSFEVHTTDTLAAGEAELLKFSLLVKVCKYIDIFESR